MSEQTEYRFSFGPWNISEGADPFGPEVREPGTFEAKLDLYQGQESHECSLSQDIPVVSMCFLCLKIHPQALSSWCQRK